jgi:hypothetical protein
MKLRKTLYVLLSFAIGFVAFFPSAYVGKYKETMDWISVTLCYVIGAGLAYIAFKLIPQYYYRTERERSTSKTN